MAEPCPFFGFKSTDDAIGLCAADARADGPSLPHCMLARMPEADRCWRYWRARAREAERRIEKARRAARGLRREYEAHPSPASAVAESILEELGEET